MAKVLDCHAKQLKVLGQAFRAAAGAATKPAAMMAARDYRAQFRELAQKREGMA